MKHRNSIASRAGKWAAVGCVLAGAVLFSGNPAKAQGAQERPNFLVIVADDMAYSDLGSYGSEIKTPALDQLAEEGVRFTDFYVSPTCSPSRAMLLTGTDNHVAGLGTMGELLTPGQQGKPGYEGVLNQSVVTVASLLREAGYHTYMTGKWHLGLEPDQIPHARGFERDFTLLHGGGSHFDDMWSIEWQRGKAAYTEDGQPLEKLPKGFYSSKNYAEKMIQFIDEGRGDGKPFLAYMAYTAPHGPLHLPNDWLRRYNGKYNMGWDVLRLQRFQAQKKLGIIPENVELTPRLWFLPRMSDLAPFVQRAQARKMELYAGMVEYMDMSIGWVVDYLKEIDEYDNTVIIFFSDNGAEGTDMVHWLAGKPGTMGFLHAASFFPETDQLHLGRKGTFAEYGAAWATAGTVPFRMYKGHLSEGGIRSPLIVKGPDVDGAGSWNKTASLHIKDIAPTLLDLAGVDHPDTFQGREVAPMQGKSWVTMLRGETDSPRRSDDWLGFELFGNRAIRKSNWKMLSEMEPYGTGDWQLYNLAEDPGEQHDLADQHPEKLKELIAHWDEYVKENGVVMGAVSVFDGHKKGLPDPRMEHDNWPPEYGRQIKQPSSLEFHKSKGDK